MNLLEKVWQRQLDRNGSAASQYKYMLQFISTKDELTDKEIDQLDEVLKRNNYNWEQVKTDMEAIERLNTLQPLADSVSEAKAEMMQALVASSEYSDYVIRERIRLDNGTDKHESLKTDARQSFSNANDAIVEIENIKRNKPHLFD